MRRGLATSRTSAREAIESGRVTVSGSTATKPSRMVDPSEPVELTGPPPRYVGRGGLKLERALAAFGIDPSGTRCLDVGSSTGGFTDCLLQHGASEVVAVDVGTGQLDWSLRNDPRVRVLERTDVRDLDAAALGSFDLVVVDVSFISLRTVMPALTALAGAAPVVALVKPQFEVGRKHVGSGGVVRDPSLHTEAVDGVIGAAGAHGLAHVATEESPVTGADGNREFLVLLRRSGE